MTDKQTKKDKLRPVAPRGVDPRSPAPEIFRVCRSGGTLHISSKHYMGPTPFYGARAEKKPKKPILPRSKCRLSGDINEQLLLLLFHGCNRKTASDASDRRICRTDASDPNLTLTPTPTLGVSTMSWSVQCVSLP